MKENCPVCGSIPTFVGRDFFKKSRCVHGHKWHTCLIHNVINEEWPKSDNYSKCTCSEQNTEEVSTLKTQEVLDALSAMHTPDKWAFFEELRIGTGYGKDNEQRMDAWAIHYFPSKQNLVRCYEIKVSRSDFFHEIQKPIKRRAGMRLSNEFWFVTPKNLLMLHEVPPECGLLEVQNNGKISVKIKAPYRNTIPPTFLFLASICRRVDKERYNAYEKIKSIIMKSYNDIDIAKTILQEHINKWSQYNKGNKQVPDMIADAMKEVLSDLEKAKDDINSYDILNRKV